MPMNRRFTKLVPLALAVAALAAPAAIAAQPVGVAGPTGAHPVRVHVDARRLCTTTDERGYPNAVPPILPPPPCSALAMIEHQEAFEGQGFWNDPPAHAAYSNAEMNAYAREGR